LVPGPVWTGAENLASTGILFPDRPARSESLYRLRYPGLPFVVYHIDRRMGMLEQTKHKFQITQL